MLWYTKCLLIRNWKKMVEVLPWYINKKECSTIWSKRFKRNATRYAAIYHVIRLLSSVYYCKFLLDLYGVCRAHCDAYSYYWSVIKHSSNHYQIKQLHAADKFLLVQWKLLWKSVNSSGIKQCLSETIKSNFLGLGKHITSELQNAIRFIKISLLISMMCIANQWKLLLSA